MASTIKALGPTFGSAQSLPDHHADGNRPSPLRAGGHPSPFLVQRSAYSFDYMNTPTPRALSRAHSSFVSALSHAASVISEQALAYPPPPLYCYALAAMACLNSCNLGYDVGSVGGAALLMKEDLGWSEAALGVFVGIFNFFTVFGAINAGSICDKIGRRRTFTVSCTVFIFGLTIQVASSSFAIAMVGRVFVGIGVGLGLAIDPLYISEMSPPAYRGQLVSFSEVAINFGIMLGFISDYVFLGLPSGINWRVMLGLGMVMPTILIILSLAVMPESPRWLLMKGRREEALKVLRRTYPEGENLEQVADEICHALQVDEEMDRGSSWQTIMCPSPIVRRMLLAGIGLAACQQVNGSESFLYFTQEILEKAGFASRGESFGMSILIALSKMIFTLVAVLYSDHAGRRPLILLSIAGLVFCSFLMAGVSPYPSLNGVMVFAMCAFMAFFSIAMGPLTWVGASEVFPTTIRAKAMSLAVSVNRFIAGIVSVTTLPLLKVFGSSGYFSFYGALTVLSGIYVYVFFPETKGRSLEDVEAHFEEILGLKSIQEADDEEEVKVE